MQYICIFSLYIGKYYICLCETFLNRFDNCIHGVYTLILIDIIIKRFSIATQFIILKKLSRQDCLTKTRFESLILYVIINKSFIQIYYVNRYTAGNHRSLQYNVSV